MAQGPFWVLRSGHDLISKAPAGFCLRLGRNWVAERAFLGLMQGCAVAPPPHRPTSGGSLFVGQRGSHLLFQAFG